MSAFAAWRRRAKNETQPPNLEKSASFSVGRDMIELMGGPFRFNKKERKRLRRSAKRAAIAADKFETEAIKPDAVPVLRLLAELDMSQAKSRKKKKPKNPN